MIKIRKTSRVKNFRKLTGIPRASYQKNLEALQNVAPSQSTLLRWMFSSPQGSTYKRSSQVNTSTFLESLTHIFSMSMKINWTIRGIMSLTGPTASSLKIMVIGKMHRNYDIRRKHKVGQILWRTVRPRITTQQAIRSRWLATDI